MADILAVRKNRFQIVQSTAALFLHSAHRLPRAYRFQCCLGTRNACAAFAGHPDSIGAFAPAERFSTARSSEDPLRCCEFPAAHGTLRKIYLYPSTSSGNGSARCSATILKIRQDGSIRIAPAAQIACLKGTPCLSGRTPPEIWDSLSGQWNSCVPHIELRDRTRRAPSVPLVTDGTFLRFLSELPNWFHPSPTPLLRWSAPAFARSCASAPIEAAAPAFPLPASAPSWRLASTGIR